MLGLKLNHVSKRGHRPQWVKLKAASNFLFYDLLLISLVCLGSVNVWQNDCQATDINQVLPNIHYFYAKGKCLYLLWQGKHYIGQVWDWHDDCTRGVVQASPTTLLSWLLKWRYRCDVIMVIVSLSELSHKTRFHPVSIFFYILNIT